MDENRLSPACWGRLSSSTRVASPHGVAAFAVAVFFMEATLRRILQRVWNDFVPKLQQRLGRYTAVPRSTSPRAIWTGSISFGLVNVPVRMYSAVDEHDLHFNLIHEPDDSRIGYQKVCKKEEKPVPDNEIVKAFEFEKDEFVVLTDEDFEAVKSEGVKSIDISDFVPYDEVDPIYFERTYYLGPQNGGEKVYALLRKAMEETKLAAIAKFVMRDRQHLGCLRVRDGVITLERMFFHDEIRPSDEIAPTGVRVGKGELEMASCPDRAVQGEVQAREIRGHVPQSPARPDPREAEGGDDHGAGAGGRGGADRSHGGAARVGRGGEAVQQTGRTKRSPSRRPASRKASRR